MERKGLPAAAGPIRSRGGQSKKLPRTWEKSHKKGGGSLRPLHDTRASRTAQVSTEPQMARVPQPSRVNAASGTGTAVLREGSHSDATKAAISSAPTANTTSPGVRSHTSTSTIGRSMNSAERAYQ